MTDDPSLKWLIRITFASIKDNRPIFPNPLDEPVLFNRFNQWISEALEDARAIDQETKRAKSLIPKIPGINLPE